MSSVDGFFGAGDCWTGSLVFSVSVGLTGVAILYFLGRVEYPDATKNKPNRINTITNAAVIKFIGKKKIKTIRMKQTIPKAYEIMSNRKGITLA